MAVDKRDIIDWCDKCVENRGRIPEDYVCRACLRTTIHDMGLVQKPNAFYVGGE